MANKKISEFPVTTSLAGGDAFLINHLGTTSTVQYDSLSSTLFRTISSSILNKITETTTTRTVDVSSISGTNMSQYTFKLEDSNKIMLCNNTKALTAIIPSNTFNIGTEIILIQNKSSMVTLSTQAGVILNSYGNRYKLRGVNAGVTIINIENNKWFLGGNTI